MKASFDDKEKIILRGQAGKLATKHLCSQKYVKFIIDGQRDVKSKLSKRILADLLALIEVLSSPDSNSNQ